MKAILTTLFLALAAPGLTAQATAAPAPAPFVPVADTSKVGPALPEGRMRPVSLSAPDGAAFFIVEESVARRGDEVDYWVLMVFDPPKPLRQGSVRQGIFHLVLDCKARTARKLFFAAYGDTGPSLAAEGTPDAPAKPLVEKTGPWFQAEVLCDGDEAVKDRVTGDAEAIAAASDALAAARADK